MKFIIILLALGIERWLHVGDLLHRFNWFDKYVVFIRKWLVTAGLWKGFQGAILFVLPLVIVVALINAFLGPLAHEFVSALVAFTILLYCLGPKSFYAPYRHLVAAQNTTELEQQEEWVDELTELPPNKLSLANRAVAQELLANFNESIFAVLFWFVFLGPLGAVLYRGASLIRRHAEQVGSEDAVLSPGAKLLHDLLDWIPIRILTLGFALVGNFVESFAYWLTHALSSLTESKVFLEQIAFLAAGFKIEEPTIATGEEPKAVLGLTDRALILFLLLYFVFVLGAWAY